MLLCDWGIARYLIAAGEQIASREATECFFAMTKLFQSQNINLRKMMCVVRYGRLLFAI